MDKCREDFEKLAIAICADHKIWLEDHVHFKHGTYVPQDYKNEFHCQHSAYFGFSWLIYEQQQKQIDELNLIIELRDQQLTDEIALSTKYVGKFDELQVQVNAINQLIEDYKDPLISSDKAYRHALISVADELEQALICRKLNI